VKLSPRFGRLIYISALAMVVGVLSGASGSKISESLAAFVAQRANRSPLLVEASVVRVAVRGNPGFAHILPTRTTTAEGFSVDAFTFLAAETKVKAEYVSIGPRDAISALTSGQVDVVPDIAITASRMEVVDFIGPYLLSYDSVMTKGEKARTIGDLRGKKVCSVDDPAASGLPVISTVAPSLPHCLDLLDKGQVDAVMGDVLALQRLAAGRDLTVAADIRVGEATRYGMAVPLGRARGDDCRKLTRLLQEFVVSGRWQDSFMENFKAVSKPAAGLPADPSTFRPNLGEITSCR
jgi:ABC-type amino acid transport substrate-binding protein